jgi:hypothetical protein
MLLGASDRSREARFGIGLLAMLVAVHGFVSNKTGACEFARRYYDALCKEFLGTRGSASVSFSSAFSQQEANLTRLVSEAWLCLQCGYSVLPQLDGYKDQVAQCRRRVADLLASGRIIGDQVLCNNWSAIVGGLLPSYVHMMHNRLGISPREESFVAYCLHMALKDSGNYAGAR